MANVHRGRTRFFTTISTALTIIVIGMAFLPPASIEAQELTPRVGTQLPGGLTTTEEAEVFLSTLRIIRDFGLNPYSDDELWEKAIEGLVNELNDPFAAVLSRREAAEFEEESTGNYAGIGVQITELNGVVTITAVFRSTPADREGLLVGDRIVGVDGESAVGWTTDEASRNIRGTPGTSVVVLIERDGITQPIPHTIQREQVHVPAVEADRLSDGIDYVVMDRVARNSAAEVDQVLRELNGSGGLILDLRGNPGGYLDESLQLADLFLDRGDIIASTKARRPGRQGEPEEESAYARSAPRTPDIPIIVLVDRFSASASEIIAGALQDHDRALVIGERTFGKGSVQSVVPLPGGRLLRITSGEWYTPLGRSLNRLRDREGRIIEPDTIEAFTTRAGRTLLGGGGVAPDLDIRADTLTLEEQHFLTAVVDAEISLAQRIQEAAFGVVTQVRQGRTLPDGFPDAEFDTFVNELRTSGISAEVLTPDVRDYLRWHLDVTMYQRMDRLGNSIEARARRDPALATALELLRASSTQTELFARAEASDAGPPVPPEGAVIVQRAARNLPPG